MVVVVRVAEIVNESDVGNAHFAQAFEHGEIDRLGRGAEHLGLRLALQRGDQRIHAGQIGLAVALRYAPGDLTGDSAPPELRAMIEQQAAKLEEAAAALGEATGTSSAGETDASFRRCLTTATDTNW